MTDRAYKTPVKDLLAAIPHDLVIQWQDKDGLKAWHNCPIGKLAREAIAALEAEPLPESVEEWIQKRKACPLEVPRFQDVLYVGDVVDYLTQLHSQHQAELELLRSKLALVLRENRRLSDELKKVDSELAAKDAEIAKLRNVISRVADNIAGSSATIVERSAQVGEALQRGDTVAQEIINAAKEQGRREALQGVPVFALQQAIAARNIVHGIHDDTERKLLTALLESAREAQEKT